MSNQTGPRLDELQVMRLGSGQILLRGSAVQVVSQLAELGARHWYAIDGGTTSPAVAALLRALKDESACHVRANVPTEVPEPAAHASSTHEVTHWLTTKEAARELGCSERHVRRIATSLGARRERTTWQYDANVVAAYTLSKHHHEGEHS